MTLVLYTVEGFIRFNRVYSVGYHGTRLYGSAWCCVEGSLGSSSAWCCDLGSLGSCSAWCCDLGSLGGKDCYSLPAVHTCR